MPKEVFGADSSSMKIGSPCLMNRLTDAEWRSASLSSRGSMLAMGRSLAWLAPW